MLGDSRRFSSALRTDRLILRHWRDSDREPFHALSSDPEVMEHFPALMTREQSDGMASRIETSFQERGLGLWALEIPGVAPFLGYTGLAVPRFESPTFGSCVEIGWRIAKAHWGHGYVTEAARAALDDGFSRLNLPEVLSFTVQENRRSWSVMDRLGMRRTPELDFDHPMIPDGHRLKRHIVYRMTKQDWEKRAPTPGVP
jgi:RimJ/RimL family protein N-acetyltransferase